MPHHRLSPVEKGQVERVPKNIPTRAVKLLGAIRNRLGKLFPHMNEQQLDDATERVLYHARECRRKQDKEIHPQLFKEQRP